MFRRLLLLLVLAQPFADYAQASDEHAPKHRSRRYVNAITLNFPNYVQCTAYPGIGIGAEYKRLLSQKGNLSASLSFTRLLWAGTMETGESYATGTRANIAANLIAPGLNYHPFGTGGYVEIGGLILLGAIRRIDSYRPRNSGDVFDSTERAFFVAPQIHFGISSQGRGHFLLTVYGDFGPILTAGSKTHGNYGVVGMKIGRRF